MGKTIVFNGGAVGIMDPITEQLKELQETAPRQYPNLTGHTPTWRLKPLIDYHKSEKEQS